MVSVLCRLEWLPLMKTDFCDILFTLGARGLAPAQPPEYAPYRLAVDRTVQFPEDLGGHAPCAMRGSCGTDLLDRLLHFGVRRHVSGYGGVIPRLLGYPQCRSALFSPITSCTMRAAFILARPPALFLKRRWPPHTLRMTFERGDLFLRRLECLDASGPSSELRPPARNFSFHPYAVRGTRLCSRHISAMLACGLRVWSTMLTSGLSCAV